MNRVVAIVCFLAFEPMAAASSDEWTVFESSETGVKFRYPSPLLTVTETDGRVTLVHSVPYRHADPCYFEEDQAQLSLVVDFKVTLTVVPANLPETFRRLENKYVTSDFLRGDQIIESPGYIDEVRIGSFRGYSITGGSHGCGLWRFYLRINEDRTMVVERIYVAELSASYEYSDEVRALPGLIQEDGATRLFEAIISSCTPID